MTPSTGNAVNNEHINAISVADVAITSLLLSFAVAVNTEELIFLPNSALKTAIHSFTAIEKTSENKTAKLNLISTGFIIFSTEFFKSSIPTNIIKAAIIREVRYSILP